MGDNLARARWMGLLAAATLAATALGALWPATAQEPSACRLSPNKVAAPARIALGETVRVTLTLSADCPAEMAPVDVVLVIDVSASMANENRLVNAKRAAHAFIDVMDLEQSRVGLVTFNHRAGVRSPLVGAAEERRVRSAVDSLIAGGQTDISAAIDVARELLAADDVGHEHAMVVLSDGYNTVSGADPVPVAAARAKADGTVVATICAGGDCDPDLAPAASRPELYFSVPDTSQLPQLYRELATSLQANAITSLTVRDEIPNNMRFIEGSAVPPPTRAGTAPDAYLEWDVGATFPPDGISYSLEPTEPGTHPTNVVATARFLDRRGRSGDGTFPVPEVVVIPPPCVPRALDVYFMIDDSNCLYGAVLNDMAALDAIRIGVERVLDQMSMGRDRAAVIGFGDVAVLLQPLTADRQAVVDAVMQVAMRDDSARLDLAYAKVRAELQGPLTRPRAQVATIFVTDGPIMPSLEMADQQARLLRGAGVLNYGIGVGDLAQHGLLRLVCEPGGYREIDFGGDCIGAYEDLGAIVGPMGDECLPLDGVTPTLEPRVTATPTRRPPPGPFRAYLPSVGR